MRRPLGVKAAVDPLVEAAAVLQGAERARAHAAFSPQGNNPAAAAPAPPPPADGGLMLFNDFEEVKPQQPLFSRVPPTRTP